MLHTTAIRSSAFTSTSCGCGSSGSQKKITESSRPSAIAAPTCWSPPSGPLRNRFTGRPSSSAISAPVVPVACRSCLASVSRLKRAQSSMSALQLSCAISAICLRVGLGSGGTRERLPSRGRDLAAAERERFEHAVEVLAVEPPRKLPDADDALGLPEVVGDADEHLRAARHRLGLGQQAGPVETVVADVRRASRADRRAVQDVPDGRILGDLQLVHEAPLLRYNRYAP